jgi:hypothetical protein
MIYYLTDVIEERFYPKAPEAGADLPRAGSSLEIYYLLISLTLPIRFLNDLDLSSVVVIFDRFD